MSMIYLAELYLEITDKLDPKDITPEIAQTRIDCFDMLIEAGSK